MLAVLRYAAGTTTDIRGNDELPHGIGLFAPRYIAQHLTEIVQFTRAVFSARDNTPVLLQSTKIELIVNIRADDEYGVAG